MNKKNILLSLCIALTLILFTNSIVVAKDFSDVPKTSPYYEAINLLSNLDILNGTGAGKFQPNSGVKRGEFAKITTLVLGIDSTGLSSTSKFTDVKGHWANSFIKAAVDKAVIDGMTKTTFAPEGSITYEQAVKMMICTLGYKTDAQKIATTSKNWSKGYFEVANKLSVLKGLDNISKTAKLSRGQVSILVYNCLSVKIK